MALDLQTIKDILGVFESVKKRRSLTAEEQREYDDLMAELYKRYGC